MIAPLIREEKTGTARAVLGGVDVAPIPTILPTMAAKTMDVVLASTVGGTMDTMDVVLEMALAGVMASIGRCTALLAVLSPPATASQVATLSLLLLFLSHPLLLLSLGRLRRVCPETR